MEPIVGAEQPVDLREYLAVLRTRKWTIMIVMILVTAAVLAYSYRQTNIYTARARLLIAPFQGQVIALNLETEAEVVTSVPVAVLVQEDLETSSSADSLLGGVSAIPSSETGTVLNVSYVSADPGLAQAAANSFAENYVEYRREQYRESIVSDRQGILQKVDRARAALEDMAERIQRAKANGNNGLVTSLETERSIVIARMGVLQQQLDNIQPESAASNGGGEVIEPASLPGTPSSPNHRNDGIMGVMLGLIAGIGMAFLRDRLDDRFKGRSDVERTLEAPVLATIPKYSVHRISGRPELAVLTDPHGPASETYRGLRTNVQFLTAERRVKSLIMTSAAAGEGKSLTTANLATALAQTRARVIVVSADLRRPTIERYFGIRSERGLAEWLTHGHDDLGSLLKDPGLPNLRILPSGKVPPNPTELLASPRFPELVDLLEGAADMVLFDSPPVLPVADAQIMATHVGGVILVIDSSKTHRSAGSRAKSEVERVGGQIIGATLNSYDPETSPYYYEPGYRYYAQYAEDPQDKGSSNGKKRSKSTKGSKSPKKVRSR
jgi:capsular exopolysaccharide synthesis family protein